MSPDLRARGRGLSSVLALCCMATPALGEGTRIYVQTFDPRSSQPDNVRLLVERSEGLETFAKTAWSAARGAACDEVKAQLPGAVLRNLSGSKVPSNEISCDFGPASSAAVSKSGNRLVTTMRVPTNHVRMKIELDGGRPDFYVKVPFAINATLTASAGGSGRLLTLEGITARIEAGKVDVDGATVVGDLAIKVADLIGINVRAIIAKGVESQRISMDGAVSSFNAAMSQGAPSQIAEAASIGIWQTGGIVAFVLVPRFPAMPRAAISGAIIAKPKMPDCSNLGVKASARGPGKLMNPFATPAAFTPGAEIFSSSVQTARMGTPVGQEGVPIERRCTYHIADAPIGAEPIVDASIGRSQSPQRSPTVTPPQKTARAPATNVDFETGWSLASNPNWLEDRVKPRVIDIRPGDRLREPAGTPRGPVIITKPGGVKKLPTRKRVLQ